MDLDRDLRRRVALGLLGVGLLALVALVLRGFLATIVFTVFLYYASRPIYRGLSRIPLPTRLRQQSLPYRRQLQAVTTIALFLLPFLLLLTYTLVLLVPEIQRVLGGEDQIAAYLSALGIGQSETLSQAVAELRATGVFPVTPEELTALLGEADVQAWLRQLGTGIVESVGLVLTLALHGFIMLAGTYYLLTDGPRLAGWILDQFDETGMLEAYGRAVDDELSSILFGNILNALVTGIIAIVVYTAYNVVAPSSVDVPFAPLAGALTGVGSLIPVVGMKIVYLPIGALLAALALTMGQPGALAFVVAFLVVTFVLVDTIPDFLIRPYVSGDRTHVGLLMFAYILGPIAFGYYGIFLGPIILVFVAQFLKIVAPYVVTGEVPGRQVSLDAFDEKP